MAETLPALPVDLIRLGTRAAEFARTSRSPATERAYRSDWADFARWCELAGLIALPAEPTTIGAYLSDRADSLKVATLNRRIAAITAAHRMAGQGLDGGHPAIVRVLGGIRRVYGTKQTAKTAILTEDLRRMVRALPATRRPRGRCANAAARAVGPQRRNRDRRQRKRCATGAAAQAARPPRRQIRPHGDAGGAKPPDRQCGAAGLGRLLQHGTQTRLWSLRRRVRRAPQDAGLAGRVSPHGQRLNCISSDLIRQS